MDLLVGGSTAAALRSAGNGIVQCAGFASSLHSSSCSRSRPSSVALSVRAKIKKGKMGPEEEYPWPEKFPPGEITHGALKYLNRFKPLPNPGKPLMLPFERPIADLEHKIDEVRILANETGLDFTDQIAELEARYHQVRQDLYGALTPMQRLSVARHPNRPTFLDHVMNMTDSWIELHGDRGGFDDPALVCGIGSMDGMSFMFIGHQKGRNTKENIHRNFAMPMPNGYRKALRFMRHAEKFGFPILTFIDTPGAYAGVKAEELGQGEAIAVNLREMFGIRVPIIATVIGEGGSGGALAIGCGNKMIMLENAVYYVASPEACAAILWKTSDAAPKAAEALRITAHELQKLDVVDDIIPEPVGGAHSDPVQTSLNIKAMIMKHMKELLKKDPETLLEERSEKFRKIGAIDESGAVDPHIKRNMKKRDALHEDDELRMLPSGNGSAPKLSLLTSESSRE